MVRFPVKAERRSNANDQPAPLVPQEMVGIFDDFGYWASLGGASIEMPVEFEPVAEKIARMINAAYCQGSADAQEAIRSALGLSA